MNSLEEIRNILSYLGRTEHDGDVKGSHLMKVLLYLQRKKAECFDDTVYKLALICGMNSRYIRENYLKGIMCFEIIETYHVGNQLNWKWIGLKAFEENPELINEIPKIEPIEENIENLSEKLKKNKSKKEKNVNILAEDSKNKFTKKCKNPECNNLIHKDLDFCSEECINSYKESKKK